MGEQPVALHVILCAVQVVPSSCRLFPEQLTVSKTHQRMVPWASALPLLLLGFPCQYRQTESPMMRFPPSSKWKARPQPQLVEAESRWVTFSPPSTYGDATSVMKNQTFPDPHQHRWVAHWWV